MTSFEPINLSKSNISWSFRYLCKRLIWNFTYVTVFRKTPKRFGNKLRINILKLFGSQIHGNPLIYPSVKILDPSNLFVDELAAIGANVNLYNYAQIRIGRMAIISEGSFLCTGTHDYTHPYMTLTSKPITIGSYSWITSEVFIHPGVTIGEGAVIGARSVVTKDMPPWMVCAGHPCKPIKERIMLSESQ